MLIVNERWYPDTCTQITKIWGKFHDKHVNLTYVRVYWISDGNCIRINIDTHTLLKIHTHTTQTHNRTNTSLFLTWSKNCTFLAYSTIFWNCPVSAKHWMTLLGTLALRYTLRARVGSEAFTRSPSSSEHSSWNRTPTVTSQNRCVGTLPFYLATRDKC